ncbi:MAG: class I SAM-dependent methyltransferase [Deltaproteobacteria bacterium]|nr:class I SAM-dependent methyltransferase [Deltaproteobacteria bacterium]
MGDLPPPARGLELQSVLGVSAHAGGHGSTDELLAMCHLEDGARVLEVGCGIGAGAVYLARERNCQVTAVDRSPQMIEWAKKRAAGAGVGYRIEFQVASVDRLPFDDGAFDVVVAESVLSFIDDKDGAIAELVRVVKPGGRVGINETFWITDPPAGRGTEVQQLGVELLSSEQWQALWEKTGLDPRDSRFYSIEAAEESKNLRRWLGWRCALRIWWRGLGLRLRDGAAFRSLRAQLRAPAGLVDCLGYGLFVGEKQPARARAAG